MSEYLKITRVSYEKVSKREQSAVLNALLNCEYMGLARGIDPLDGSSFRAVRGLEAQWAEAEGRMGDAEVGTAVMTTVHKFCCEGSRGQRAAGGIAGVKRK